MAVSNDASPLRRIGLCRPCLALGIVAVFVSGCGGPARIAPPDWDPDAMADAAMQQSDKNGDGILDATELAAAPGLKAAAEAEAGAADTNGDGKLTRDEIRDRIAFYEERATGYEIASIKILVGKQPLAGAEVKLVPEPFLSGVLEEAAATTRDETGLAMPQIPGVGFEGVRPGMYRIQVTHPSGLPAKYNENTILGIELAPSRDGYTSPGPTVFELERS